MTFDPNEARSIAEKVLRIQGLREKNFSELLGRTLLIAHPKAEWE